MVNSCIREEALAYYGTLLAIARLGTGRYKTKCLIYVHFRFEILVQLQSKIAYCNAMVFSLPVVTLVLQETIPLE